jgi:hypothetical protein
VTVIRAILTIGTSVWSRKRSAAPLTSRVGRGVRPLASMAQSRACFRSEEATRQRCTTRRSRFHESDDDDLDDPKPIAPTERGTKAIGHDPPARTESLAGTPNVGTTDAVKDDADIEVDKFGRKRNCVVTTLIAESVLTRSTKCSCSHTHSACCKIRLLACSSVA